MHNRSLMSLAGLAALGLAMSAGPTAPVAAGPARKRRAKRVLAAPGNAPHTATFVGDGCDADRLERAERKRARKAAKLGTGR